MKCRLLNSLLFRHLPLRCGHYYLQGELKLREHSFALAPHEPEEHLLLLGATEVLGNPLPRRLFRQLVLKVQLLEALQVLGPAIKVVNA